MICGLVLSSQATFKLPSHLSGGCWSLRGLSAKIALQTPLHFFSALKNNLQSTGGEVFKTYT